MAVLFHAALEAGALGVYLSGAGSTVAALVENSTAAANKVAKAMAAAAARDGISGHPLVSTIRDTGACVDEDA
jgi:homoserine kinase